MSLAYSNRRPLSQGCGATRDQISETQPPHQDPRVLKQPTRSTHQHGGSTLCEQQQTQQQQQHKLGKSTRENTGQTLLGIIYSYQACLVMAAPIDQYQGARTPNHRCYVVRHAQTVGKQKTPIHFIIHQTRTQNVSRPRGVKKIGWNLNVVPRRMVKRETGLYVIQCRDVGIVTH